MKERPTEERYVRLLRWDVHQQITATMLLNVVLCVKGIKMLFLINLVFYQIQNTRWSLMLSITEKSTKWDMNISESVCLIFCCSVVEQFHKKYQKMKESEIMQENKIKMKMFLVLCCIVSCFIHFASFCFVLLRFATELVNKIPLLQDSSSSVLWIDRIKYS